MLVPGLETEHVARQMEGSDLTAPIDQNLVGPHRSAHDLVEVIGRFVLPVDFVVAGERHEGAHQLDRAGLGMPVRGLPVAGLLPMGC